MERRLLVTRRDVPLDRTEQYLAAWAELRAVAGNRRIRAWLFQAAHREDRFLEFLEWQQAPSGDDGSPAVYEEDAVAAARRALDEAFGPGVAGEWREADPFALEEAP